MSKDYLDVWVYDVETFKSCFTAVFANESKKKMYVFEISDRKDDSARLRKFITQMYKEKATFVGFNNLNFDWNIILYFLENKGCTSDDIHEFANEIIRAQNSDEDKFKYRVPKNKEWVRQVDLYLINHFNNKARATSLKMIEFNMRSNTIEDLPYHPSDDLTSEQIEQVVSYNIHDVKKTLEFYKECIPAVQFRDELSRQMGMDTTNMDDTKIGKAKFLQELEKENPEVAYRVVGGKRIMKQTKRKSIDLSEVILPNIEFSRPEFQAVLDWISSQTITETKGVFSDIEEHDLGELAKYANMTTKSKKIKTKPVVTDKDEKKALRKELRETDDESRILEIEALLYGEPDKKEIEGMLKARPCSWIDRQRLKSGGISYYWRWNVAETLNTVVEGLQFDYGTGGLHGATDGTTYRKSDTVSIQSWDVASYYPNLSIQNRLYPEHMGEMFCDVYQDLYNQRKSYAKGTPQNAVLKLSLNGTYGASNDKYSPFYDPKFTMAITLNGQLQLSMLAEMLIEGCDTVKIIMANTDGLEFIVHPDEVEKSKSICAEWEKITKLELEGEEYEVLAINNVNNYCGIFTGGKVKRKGAYEYQGLGWHQNQSALIIKEAAVKQILEGIPVEQTIRNCKDPFDFVLRTKVPRSSRLVLRYEDGTEYAQQNITRYFISNTGGKLIKVMPPLPEKEDEREIGIDAAWLVKTCNNMKDFDWSINYDYYIGEARKLVEGVGELT